VAAAMRFHTLTRWFAGLALLLGLALPGQGQGTFQNLGFESASLVSAGDSQVQFGPAFPRWVGTVGGVQQTIALSNTVALDTAGVSIINSNYNAYGFIPGGVIEGRFTAILQAGYGSGVPADTVLSQTGLVPANAQSLQFQALQTVGGGTAIIPFAVALGGQTLSLVTLGNGVNYTLYGADISSWAGQTTPLSFTVFAERPHLNNQYLYLDAIRFSSQPIVPEPSLFGLAALATLLLGRRALGRRR